MEKTPWKFLHSIHSSTIYIRLITWCFCTGNTAKFVHTTDMLENGNSETCLTSEESRCINKLPCSQQSSPMNRYLIILFIRYNTAGAFFDGWYMHKQKRWYHLTGMQYIWLRLQKFRICQWARFSMQLGNQHASTMQG